jgi:flagellar biosynthesis/type III secretory pathway chaperone
MPQDTRIALFLSSLSTRTGTPWSSEPTSVVSSDYTPGFTLKRGIKLYEERIDICRQLNLSNEYLMKFSLHPVRDLLLY